MEYDDILHLPHHRSKKRRGMPLSDRAAQFAPFAALTGYEEAVKETARLTEERLELSESAQGELDETLRFLAENPGGAVITYFVPDPKKKGGTYVTVSGTVKKICGYEGLLVFTDGTTIPVKEILECELIK